jgi:hypothetical protein
MQSSLRGDPLSENPLRVLGVELPVSDDAVREVYVEMVRRHPPERDPAAFQRIRQAYEQLRTVTDRLRWALLHVESPPERPEQDKGEVAGPLGLPASWWLMADPWAELQRTDFASDCRDVLAGAGPAAAAVAATREGGPPDA